MNMAWLTQPHESFSQYESMSFLDLRLNEKFSILIWYPSEKSFMHCMERDFYASGKNSALFVCPNTDTIDWEQVEQEDTKKQITKMLKNTPMFSEYKSLCFSPWEDFTAGGGV